MDETLRRAAGGAITRFWFREDSASAESTACCVPFGTFAPNQIPYFGICLGMECAVIEFARNVCGLQADSSEFDPSAPHRVFYMLRELLGSDMMGGNMRLGAFPCVLEEGSLARAIYQKTEISERHRHRYEFNREYEKILASYGMRFSGNSPDRNFVEIIELPDHPWFLGCQFHPEFKSKPFQPHPLFAGFVKAAYQRKLQVDQVDPRGV